MAGPDFPVLMKKLLPLLAMSLSITAFSPASPAGDYVRENDVSYLEGESLAGADAYRREQCRMDLYLPAGKPGFPTLVWFHGGGLTGGKRHLPSLQNKGIGLIAVGYRLSPAAGHPAYLEDAAAAVAWTLRHIAERGGDPAKVFVAGHSAGGYLAAMIGMDPQWLATHGLSHQDLAGIIPVSAQVTTHFLVKKLRGDAGPEFRPVIDEFAPLHHASKNLPPVCLILGDRKIEYKNRVEENELLAASLRNLGHPLVEFYEMGGLDHGTVVSGAWILMPGFIKRALEHQAKTEK